MENFEKSKNQTIVEIVNTLYPAEKLGYWRESDINNLEKLYTEGLYEINFGDEGGCGEKFLDWVYKTYGSPTREFISGFIKREINSRIPINITVNRCRWLYKTFPSIIQEELGTKYINFLEKHVVSSQIAIQTMNEDDAV
jgi:hypothetical protein